MCGTNSCLNGGTCIGVEEGKFVCHCDVGFNGTRCEINEGKGKKSKGHRNRQSKN